MRTRFVIATAVMAALATAAAVVSYVDADAAEPALNTKLLEHAIEEMHDAGAPGVIAQVRDGAETWNGAAGVRELGDDAPPKPTDRIRAASLTKSMISAVILRLADSGRFGLDDPIGDYLPGLLPYDEPITIRQLLNHTSGVPDHFYVVYPSMKHQSVADIEANRYKRFTPEQIVAGATKQPLEFAPGTDYKYSNTEYYVLGMLIEKLTKRSYESVLTSKILRPAHMDNSYIPRDTAVIAGPHPHAYFVTTEPDRPLLDTTNLSSTHLWAAGSAISSPGDLNKLYRALFDGTLLTKDERDRAQTLTPQSRNSYGLGIEAAPVPEDCAPVPGGVSYGHTGGGMGYSTVSFHSRDGRRQTTFTFTEDVQLSKPDDIKALQQAFQDLFLAGMCSMDGQHTDAKIAIPKTLLS
ncbi:MAG TPA: serine hydrolase domain-containing protein [Stackebrandtia sp.]|jgi:D-alanyl-D-alanine carboxypeptidase|uniref:serine hydrolase domain-containing protein n=1 Tax=Stackebrandtia sp. TaxID=2023065 RepID=UPI002D50B7F3|nr:serine hydrolase domain-containing protein [Stackebrandtia sp.]HZE40057.1 serine hydrolase domain-containing protein [Stackebrandtia sp.]